MASKISNIAPIERAFIGLGANLGNGPATLFAAWHRLAAEPGIKTLRLSSPYRTAPVGFVSEHWFTNAVGELQTRLSPQELLARLLAIESEFGRDRSRGRDRSLDLDLLFYGDLQLDEPGLRLPHPELAGRAFVLVPLVEIAADCVHPGLGLTSLELLAACPDRDEPLRFDWPGSSQEES